MTDEYKDEYDNITEPVQDDLDEEEEEPSSLPPRLGKEDLDYRDLEELE